MAQVIKRLVLSDGIDNNSAEEIIRAMIKIEDEKEKDAEKNPCDRIELWLNSFGGSISAGFALINAIRLSTIPVDTVVIGACFSMATTILQAGARRIILGGNGACIMVHPATSGIGTTRIGEFVNYGSHAEILEEQTHKLVRDRVGMTPAKYKKFIADSRYIYPKEALKLNFVDEIRRVP